MTNTTKILNIKDIENTLFNADCLEILKSIESNSIDFIFADPPYFMQVDSSLNLYRANGSKFSGCDDEWDKFSSMAEYKNFTKEWLNEAFRVLKKDGSICVISGMQSIYEIGSIMRELGFWLNNDIIWKKSNPTPNFSGNNLCNEFETILWAKKGRKARFTFNYKTAKALNGGKQMGSVWEFPVCSGSERLKDSQGNKLHSTQKPLALMRQIILLFTKPNDLVLDPFGGTFSSAFVAKELGRKYVSIEKDSKYFAYGKKRVESAKIKLDEFALASFDKKPLKVSFKELVMRGLIKIGENFYTKNGASAKLVSENGILEFKDKKDSMHLIAGAMLGKNARLNAFTNLYIKRENKLILLDEIRQRCREEIEKEIVDEDKRPESKNK